MAGGAEAPGGRGEGTDNAAVSAPKPAAVPAPKPVAPQPSYDLLPPDVRFAKRGNRDKWKVWGGCGAPWVRFWADTGNYLQQRHVVTLFSPAPPLPPFCMQAVPQAAGRSSTTLQRYLLPCFRADELATLLLGLSLLTTKPRASTVQVNV